MSNRVFGAIAPTGGTDGALDAIAVGLISNGDIALYATGVGDIFSVYTYDSSSADAESSPDIIKPDDNLGNGRWILAAFRAASIQSTPIGNMFPSSGTFTTIVGGGTCDGSVVLTSTGGTRGFALQAANSGTFISLGSTTNHDYMIHRNNVQQIDLSTAVTKFTNSIRPLSDNDVSCGIDGKRWTDVWAVDTTINSSDESAKEQIVKTPLGLAFINALIPRQYKWKDYSVEATVGSNGVETKPAHTKTFTRKHHGLVAQEVLDAMEALSISTNDFAGYIKAEHGDGLRYAEFIAPLIRAVQELSAKVEALEKDYNG